MQKRTEELGGSSPLYNPFHKEMQWTIALSINSLQMLKGTGKLWQLTRALKNMQGKAAVSQPL